MGLEDLTGSAKYISDLVNTNPVGATDLKSEGDDHIRGVKNVLLNTFPNVTGVITPTHTELSLLAGRYAVGLVKGADIVSAAPLVIGTDGNYFDVTGVVDFAVMTVAADRFFVLQFDGILTMTHHATNLDLPGEADIITAAGDSMQCFSTGADTVHVLTYTRADGTSVVGAVGGPSKGTNHVIRTNAMNLIENITLSDHSTTFTTTFAADTLDVGTDDGFADGDTVYLTTTAADLPDPLAVLTKYFVRDVTDTTCKLAATYGGAAVTLTDDGTGVHTIYQAINGMCAGPLTIETGFTLTVPTGSTLKVV